MKGLHWFVAYEGELEWVEREGLMVRANPVTYRSPVYTNVITTNGKGGMLDRLGASAVAIFANLGVGTDSTAATAAQTQLNPSVAGSVLLQTCDVTFPSRASLVLTYQATFATGVANFTWNEAGIFNGNSNGTSVMFNRVIIGPFAKTSASTIVYSTTVTQS